MSPRVQVAAVVLGSGDVIRVRGGRHLHKRWQWHTVEVELVRMVESGTERIR